MKKRVLLIASTLVLITTGLVLAQVDTTEFVVEHASNQTALEFLKANAWVFAGIVYVLLETWLGQTGKLEAGSVLQLIFNLIGGLIFRNNTLIKGKAENRANYLAAKAKKKSNGNGFRTLVIVFVLLGMGAVANAQSGKTGLFRPVDKSVFVSDNAKLSATGEPVADLKSAWVLRLNVSVTAMKFAPSDEEGETFDVTSLTSAGLGIGYSHYINMDGKPFNNYGFNALVLLDAVPTDTAPTGVSLAATFNFLQYINMGVGWDFTRKNYFLLTGVIFTF